MRRLILPVTILGALLAIGCQPPASNTANNANKPANAVNNANVAAAAANAEADIKKALTEMAALNAKNDADAIAVRLADDYYLITPQGTLQTKAERLADMKSGKTKFEDFAYEDVKVRQYGDTAVATATVRAKGTSEGKAVAPQIKATMVFVKSGGTDWKLVSTQATAVTGGQPGTANSNTSNANTNSNTNAAKASPSPANK